MCLLDKHCRLKKDPKTGLSVCATKGDVECVECIPNGQLNFNPTTVAWYVALSRTRDE